MLDGVWDGNQGHWVEQRGLSCSLKTKNKNGGAAGCMGIRNLWKGSREKVPLGVCFGTVAKHRMEGLHLDRISPRELKKVCKFEHKTGGGVLAGVVGKRGQVFGC